jgi:nitroreductase
LVWNKGVDAKAWQQAFDCLVEGNQSWVKDAPFLCLICANTLLTKNGQPNRWAEYDTGAAALNLSLQASSMGLSAHQLGGFSADKARATFNIPEQFTLMAMISVGYLLDIERVTGDLLARETAPRSRRDLGALFFDGAWDKPIM